MSSSRTWRLTSPQVFRPNNNPRSSSYGVAPPPYSFTGDALPFPDSESFSNNNPRPPPNLEQRSPPSEIDRLFRGSPSFQQKKSSSAKLKFWLSLVCFFGVVFILFGTDLVNPAVWKSRRRDYLLDRESWTTQRERWIQDKKAHLAEVSQWDQERRVFQKEHAQLVLERRLREEERLDWTATKEKYEMERREVEQEKEHIRLERANHGRELKQWEEERKAYEVGKEKRQRETAEERRLRDRERAEWERERKQHEDDRIPPGAFWEERVKSESCHSYGKREYSAKLSNIPSGWTAMQACLATPVEFHGVAVRRPDRCEYTGFLSRDVIGHWLVDFDEAECKPWHSDWQDTGCSNEGSGIRRMEAWVRDLRGGDDWEVMCATTPATIGHVHYGRPTHCSSRYFGRMVAMWDLEDPTC